MKQLLLLVLLLFSATFVIAQSTNQSDANDPRVNENANACFEGGAMEGKCDTDWEWICGWYMIRFDYSIYTREEVPGSCASLLPPLPEAATPYVFPTTGCFQLGVNYYVDFNGGNYIAFGESAYLDADCTDAAGFATDFAYAPNGMADALVICKARGFNHPYHWLGLPIWGFLHIPPKRYI